MPIALIGIDDTDNQTSPGTGKLARWLCADIVERGGRSLGITRHQLLLDDRIPYTTHNSGACLSIDWPGDVSELEFAMERIGQWAADGSDPGICIARAESVPATVMEFGRSAMREVLTMADAITLAKTASLNLRALGGSGQGIIGALASVGLRASGNDGRFLDMPGLRELGEYVTRAQLNKLGIEVEHKSAVGISVPPIDAKVYRTMDWVRPTLHNAGAVWSVEWNQEQHEWVPIDRRRSRPLE